MDDWIEWTGKMSPVSDITVVEVKLRDGSCFEDRSDAFYWHHDGDEADIVYYRVVPQPTE